MNFVFVIIQDTASPDILPCKVWLIGNTLVYIYTTVGGVVRFMYKVSLKRTVQQTKNTHMM